MPSPTSFEIEDEEWEVHCESIEHKNSLFDYAKSRGVPIINGYYDDHDLSIGFLDNSLNPWEGATGLMCCWPDKSNKAVSIEQFKAMCDAYYARYA